MKTALSRAALTWAALSDAADRLGICILNLPASVKELTEKLAELTDEAQALQNLVAKGEELTDEQNARWDELMDDETGEIASVGKKLQAAKKYEQEIKKLATIRMAQAQPGGSLGDQRGALLDDDGGQRRSPGIRVLNRGRRLKAFTGENAYEDAYNCAVWMMAMISASRGRVDRQAEAHLEKLGWGIQATATVGNPTESGYLVPSPMEAAFIERREGVGVMRQLAQIVPMMADTHSESKLLSGPSVLYPGEANAPTEASQSWGNVRLEAVKRMVLGYFSRELQRDALINVVDQFISRLAYEAAKQEDNEAINGDGTSAYGREVGILNALGSAGVQGAATGHDTWSELDVNDFTAAMGILPSDYWTDPCWVCSNAFYTIAMLPVIYKGGGATPQQMVDGVGRTRPMFLGYPVYLTDRMRKTTATNTVCALFGQFNQAIMLGERDGLETAISDHVAFTQDKTAIKGTYRIDFNVHEAGDASNAGAVVALKTAS